MKTSVQLPEISPTLLAFFSRYASSYLGRHFHSVRLLGSVPNDPPGPLVVFLNHAAWWDPLVCLSLRTEFFRQRSAFAPINAAALERYRFLRKIGFFPVEQGTARGAAQFLKTSRVILEKPENALFLTPQGQFADVRSPLILAPGIERLRRDLPGVLFLPLAIEYTFWEERKPEILLAFGEPTPAGDGRTLADQLANTQRALAAAAERRDRAEWRTLRRGRSGVSRPYDFWRWLRARLRGQAFRADHGRL
ncbi:MAG: lysophospholipid acyltransferase family protein [Verrucomicrobiota bacterium]|nr:lysophospholipid acyltransferase family protein [Verrucomicrobiota bacterium]